MTALTGLLAAAMLLQATPGFLDQRIGDHDPKAPPGMADLTMGQMMALTSLPKSRVDEARCAGLLLSPRYAGPASADRKQAVRAALIAALANDSRYDAGVAANFVTMFTAAAAEDPPVTTECAAFLAMAESSAPVALSPLLKVGAVDPVLATCHARYRIAAERADPADRVNLAREADRAHTAALKGKNGPDRAAAEQALAAAVAAERTAAQAPAERAMSSLVMCQPAMARAGA